MCDECNNEDLEHVMKECRKYKEMRDMESRRSAWLTSASTTREKSILWSWTVKRVWNSGCRVGGCMMGVEEVEKNWECRTEGNTPSSK